MPIKTVVGEAQMKTQFLKLVKTVVAPIALAIGIAAFSPVAALAQWHGGYSGGHGGYAAHSFAAPRNFGGGRGFSERGYGGGVRGGFYAGRPYYGGRGYYGGGGYYGRGYYGGRGYYAPCFSVGVYPYGYAAPTCNPSGFYDQYGNWQPYQGCEVPPGY
jgi:hypothetical protein